MVTPKSVNVMGVDIAIRIRSPKRDKELSDCYGYYDPVSCQITLRDDLKPAKRRETLAHEIGHAYVEHSGLGYTMMKLVQEDAAREYLEEKLIRSVIVPYVLTAYRFLQNTRL